jgi:L-ascorbate metabolism protein UlaG (beta-lactamase superfamily)
MTGLPSWFIMRPEQEIQHQEHSVMTRASTKGKSEGGHRPRRWIGFSLATVVAVALGLIAVAGCAGFGADPEGERLAHTHGSPQWHGDKFQGPQALWSDVSYSKLLFGSGKTGVVPDAPVPYLATDAALLARPPASGLRVTWFGHSSALVEIDGVKVLTDPLWGERTSPFPWIGPQRWFPPPLALQALADIDAVVISHDHYDHLDRASIVEMLRWRAVFVVPLGVGAHLARWGVPEQRIVELDWWQSTRVGGVELVATPARHGSGRYSAKSNKTLWAGYAMLGPRHRAWYSGDTGFHDDLPRIGERYGPFDVTMIEAGQYDVNWPDTHLGPEQAVDAHRLVRGKTMIPVHWALIKLADHGWTEPVERVLAAAQCLGVDVAVPRPGESIEPVPHVKTAAWWLQLPWQTASQSPVVATKNGNPAERVAVAPCVVKGQTAVR